MDLRLKLFRFSVFAVGLGFIAGVLVFAYAYFTVGIPDPNKFVNSQSTIIQYADGQEIGRIGSENRKILKLAAIPIMSGMPFLQPKIVIFIQSRQFLQPEFYVLYLII